MKINQKDTVWPDIAIAPGEILLDTIKALGVSQADLAARMGRPAQAINEIVNGIKRIEPATAIELERALGTPARVWVALQRDYELTKARIQDSVNIEAQTQYLSDFPYAAMAYKGWIPPRQSAREKIDELLRFFGVASFEALKETMAVYRKSPFREASKGALAAWLRRGELEAAKVQTNNYDTKTLIENLPRLRELTTEAIDSAWARLKEQCASDGIALVFVKSLPKSYVSGATYWPSSEKAVVQLTIRFRTDDQLWFSFFHEVGHILKHGKELFLDDWRKKDSLEEEADRFAANTLIPPDEYRRLLRMRRPLSKNDVRRFAARIGIAPGIVVGRLQHDVILPQSYMNDLKVRLKWSDE